MSKILSSSLMLAVAALAFFSPKKALAQAEMSNLIFVPEMVADSVLTAEGDAGQDESDGRSIFESRPGRIIANTLAGNAAGLGAYLIVGGGLSLIFCSRPGADSYCLLPALLFAFPAYPLGMALTVNLLGDALDGNGSFWAALGGSVVGLLASGVVGLSLGGASPHPVALVGSLLLPGLGAAVGYELSSDDSASASGKISVAPLLVPGGGGGLALTGSF